MTDIKAFTLLFGWEYRKVGQGSHRVLEKANKSFSDPPHVLCLGFG